MRLINADELMELYDGCNGLSVPIAVVQQNIKDATTIDAEPVRHGYWVIDDYNTRECHCSECEWPAPRDVYEYHREQTGYCPVCGAKMKVDDYE